MFHPLDYFLLRVPRLSIENFKTLTNAIRREDKEQIKDIFSSAFFLNSIYLSSKNFYYETLNWIKSDQDFGLNDKIVLTLYKYYSRMCTRATPYGTFSAFSLGTVLPSKDRVVQILFDDKWEPHVRIDLHFLDQLLKNILDKDKEANLTYIPTNTLYYCSDVIRYIESDNHKNYSVSELENSEILEHILEFSAQGSTYIELVEEIYHESEGFEKEEIRNYLNRLIDSQILIPIQPPFITSLKDPLEDSIQFLLSKRIPADCLISVEEVQMRLKKEISTAPLQELSEHFGLLYNKSLQQFQIDLEAKTCTNQISTKAVKTLCLRANEISHLYRNMDNPRLKAFVRKFEEKYERQEVPLAQALDAQYGIGYGNYVSGNIEGTELLNGILFPHKGKQNSSEVSAIIQLILAKYGSCFTEMKPIQLTETDLNSIHSEDSYPLADNYFLFGDLLSVSEVELNQGNFKFLNKSSLPTPYPEKILSRYAFHDEALKEKLKNCITDKDSNGALYVEINHVPYPRLGNVLLRPNNYQYEFAYCSISEPNELKKTITIDDLLISVRNKHITLRSKKYQKTVFLKNSAAYNHDTSQLPLIQFLGDLEKYNLYTGVSWDWQGLKGLSYLPRVEYKEIILSPARWKIEQDPKITLHGLKELLKTLKIPKFCSIQELDNVLCLDTDTDLCLEILCREIRKDKVVLFESFLEMYNNFKSGQQYVTEYIIPIKNSAQAKEDGQGLQQELERSKSNRFFSPGAEWTFYKIYCPYEFSDNIITVIGSLLVKHFANIKREFRWYFIRYQDPDHHIRMRVNVPIMQEILEMINNLLDGFGKGNGIVRLQIDTYSREIERYKIVGIENAERIFYYDSVSALKVLELISSTDNEQNRIIAAMISIDTLFSNFHIKLHDRWAIMEILFQKFRQEFIDKKNPDSTKKFKISLDAKFRTYRSVLEKILRKDDVLTHRDLRNIFDERTGQLEQVLGPLLLEVENTKLLWDTIQDLIHLSMNRLFYTKNRMHELVIYYMMFKGYKSIYERSKANH
ncbi:lantibiotic dehydratase [Chryseobacterium sp. R2ACT005]|uniref:lantibiotic dehydratase n=1 Tax=Chryseobacterium sp. R2ACT005 TaxID=3416668 RepID=UPI003CF32D60